MAMNEGNDSSFHFLLFGVVSFLLFVMVLIEVIRMCIYIKHPRRFKERLDGWKASLMYLPNLAKVAFNRPKFVKEGLAYMRAHPSYTYRVVWPKVKAVIIQPRIILISAFFFLLSIVMYQNLTFDPYVILEIPRNATEREIKVAYKKANIKWHPDKQRNDAKKEEAKAMLPRIRRAYKMLKSTEAWDEEVNTADGSKEGDVNVGLPSFLMDPNLKAITVPLLLFLVFGLPIHFIRKLMTEGSTAVILEFIDEMSWYKSEFLDAVSLLSAGTELMDNYDDAIDVYMNEFSHERFDMGKTIIVSLQEYIETKIDRAELWWRDAYENIGSQPVAKEPKAREAMAKKIKNFEKLRASYLTQFKMIQAESKKLIENFHTARLSFEGGRAPRKTWFTQIQHARKGFVKAFDSLEALKQAIEEDPLINGDRD